MWWRALGLESDADKETVKKTYAKLIKTIDQDTDIENFTNVHRAYRLALKSFRDEERVKPTEGLIDFSDKPHWYLQELAKIYNNPKRRLDAEAWKNLFACMSFIEEKHFLKEYVNFFNEHYALTEDIWALIEKYYPLSKRSDFRWHEIVNGYLNLTPEEIHGMSFDEASNYVTYKIHIFFGILDGDYDRALIFLRMLLPRYDRRDLKHWHLLIAVEANLEDEVEQAFNTMCEDPEEAHMAAYLYGGYLQRKGEMDKAAGLMRQMPEGLRASSEEVLRAEQAFQMGAVKVPDVNLMPWLALDQLSSKDKKALGKGQYGKVNGQTGQGFKFKLFGGR